MSGPDLVDRSVGRWARAIGYADDDEDVEVFTWWIADESRRTRIPRTVIALAWAGASAAMSLAVPLAVGLVLLRHPRSDLWTIVDPEGTMRKRFRITKEEGDGRAS